MKNIAVSLSKQKVFYFSLFLIFVFGIQANEKYRPIEHKSKKGLGNISNSFNSKILGNSPPVANADYYTVHGSFQTGGSTQGVLSNDTDPDGDQLSAVFSNVQTSLGMAVIYMSGDVNFQPNYGAIGAVTVPYTACDGLNACSSSTVTFNVVNQAPVAISDTYNVHGNLDTINEIPGVLVNDSDPENDPISVLGIDGGMNFQTNLGNGLVNFQGRIMFSAFYGVTGTVTVPYTVCDYLGACSSSNITLNVINSSPIALDDYYEVVKGSFETPLDQAPYGVLKNDFDAENDLPLTPVDRQVSSPDGTAYVFSNGKAAYVRAAGSTFSGAVTITYTVCDGLGGCSQANVTFLVLPQDGANDAGYFCPVVAHPINVTNGNMWFEQTDYKLPGIGENIEVRRFYNSAIQTGGLFGTGWSTEYDESLWFYDNKLLRLNMPDGRAVYFGRANLTDPFVAVSPEIYGQILKNTDNTYTLTFKDGRVHKFSSTGKLLWQKDRDGNQTSLSYDGGGNLSGVTDAFGRTLTITTNSGYVTQISDSIGTAAAYEYFPGTTFLKTVTYNDGSKYKFEYTTINNKTYLTTVKDALDYILETHLYDSQGRAYTSERHGGAEKYTLNYSNSSYTTVTDALGRVTKYYFDKSKGRNVVTKTEGNCNCGGAGSEVTQYFYDQKLNLTKKVDALGREILYTYDGSGNRLTETNVLGTENYTYNLFGQVLTRTDRMNGITTNTYNAAGNLLTTKDALNNTTTLTYKPNGLLETVKDARNNQTTLTYDAFGRLTQVKDANNKTTDYAYDARARLTGTTNALNQTTAFQYDLNNRLKKVTYADTNFEEYTYDLAGRRTKVKDTRGNETMFGYDNAYRLTSVIDALNNPTTFGYDLMSNRIRQTDALTNTTDYEYDEFNRLKKVKYPAAAGGTRLEERMEYDTLGNVKKRIDTANRETLYDYDPANRLTRATDANLQPTQFEYNARSQMTKVTDALNQIYDFSYDALGRQLSQTRAGTTMSYEYDAVGNRTKRVDYAGRQTTYNYDNLNRLTQINYLQSYEGSVPLTPIKAASYVYDDLSRLTSAVNDAGVVNFTYDNRNRIASTTDVFGHLINYGYDANGNRNLLKLDGTTHTAYVYDIANRLTTLTDEASQNFTFGYDIANRLISKTLPNGVASTFDYDGMSRLTRLKNQSSTATLTDNNFTYNGANQINQIAELTNTKNFTYDTVDRLTTMTSATLPNENYAFDAVGNRNSSQRSNAYGYQPNNKLISTQTGSYSYDANGNMLSKSDATGFWIYGWDYENRMVSARKQNKTVRYQYDALGRRVFRHGKTLGSTKYIYDGMDVVMDDDFNNGIVKYQNGLGIDEKLKMVTSGQAKYFLQDHLGSTVGLADSSGAVVSAASYDSFGNSTNNLSTRYQYTGREKDEFTGLTYYRARWYDANLGRFISEDPIGFAGGDVNLFGYVRNQPLIYRDSLGLYPGADVLPNVAGAIGSALAAAGGALAAAGGAVASSPAVVAAGGFAIGYGIGYLPGQYIANHPANPFVNGPLNPFGTPFPNQSDIWSRARPVPFPNQSENCDVKPRAIPFFRDTPERPEKSRRPECQAAMLNCLKWAKTANDVAACQLAFTKCAGTSDIVQFPHGEWVF